MIKDRYKILRIVFLFLFLGSSMTLSSQPLLAEEEGLKDKILDPLEKLVGHTEENLIQVYDEDGNYIFATSMGVSEGDEYISQDNHHFEVFKVDGQRAEAKDLGEIDLLNDEKLLGTPMIAQNQKKKIGIYHTHSAESYKPGPAFNNQKGEIYDVGGALKKNLEAKNIQVIQSTSSFLPHDGGAYDRSRGTAAELIRQDVDAVFDVHRDAIPRANEYLAEVDGEKISQVRLVVGRQNPNREPNEQMAKRLKAIADKKYPGLVKGIFLANGKYNQELSPRALLLEFGTHVTTEDEALKSTAMMADSIYTLLYGAGTAPGGGERGTDQAMGNAGWKNLLWIVGLLVVGGVIYLFVNEKGFSGAKNRLKEFTGEEFANILGRVRKRKNKRKERNDKK